MRLKLTLQTLHKPTFLPFNYQYPLSAAIYKIIKLADEEFATFLHNEGYSNGYKNFKLFTFSDIKTSFKRNGDRMQMDNEHAELIVCFYISEAAENFIKGLFLNQQLQIADRKSKTTFQVIRVAALPGNIGKSPVTVLQPISPLVVGRKNERGIYDFRSPEDEDFAECLLYNWLEKWAVVSKADSNSLQDLKDKIKIKVSFFKYPPQSRLVTIKAGTDAETKIRGFTKFKMEVVAPDELMQLALDAGLGLYNAQGMGCVEVA